MKVSGGGTSAVAASSHAACARFRGTDPLITGMTRRKLADEAGSRDVQGIPDARWMRAMTFESLIHNPGLASQLTTTAIGRLGLPRPNDVRIADAAGGPGPTVSELQNAHEAATRNGSTTLIYGMSIPFTGFEGREATDVLPDFAIVAPREGCEGGDAGGSWLIMGDAKDYERVRSRIDDGRMLKGFLQVALGAESAAGWSQLPTGMEVHKYGVLAVPRNAFLQPEAVVELLDDHREEVRMRVEQRHQEAAVASSEAAEMIDGSITAQEFISHLKATFDPSSCRTCPLFSFCRSELRQSADPRDLLIEIGVPEPLRTQIEPIVLGEGEGGEAVPDSLVARVRATVAGVAQRSQQARIDQAAQDGTVNVVIAKSDSSAVGIYGVGTQCVTEAGVGEWRFEVLEDPQSPDSRRRVMGILGEALDEVLADRLRLDPDNPDPVHLVVPDGATADVLTSVADNLAGIELSRIRWEHDLSQDREALTYGGEPASIPPALEEPARTAVSFLLEEDRARAFSLRCPVVDVRAALARHITPGGPEIESFRLDYLVAWAEAEPGNTTSNRSAFHRDLSDQIESEEHTPGARLSKLRSDAIHEAFVGTATGSPRPADPDAYRVLIEEELAYKAHVLGRALAALDEFPESNLRAIHRIIEGDAQAVWRRRREFHASDLVRFGRSPRFWRDNLVPLIDQDGACADQLLALTNPRAALDRARDAGAREIASATVISLDPLALDIDSRQFNDGSRIVLLHVGSEASVEGPDVGLKIQKGSFKVSGLSIGPVEQLDEDDPQRFEWDPAKDPGLKVGDILVVADRDWFSDLVNNNDLPLPRLKPDATLAPREDCSQGDYVADPEGHSWCCRPHELAEAEWADELADKRANGELNPEVWPPVVDVDGFEVSPVGAAEGDPTDRPAEDAPEALTLDDLE